MTGAVSKRYRGDRDLAQAYLPVARVFLGRMMAYLGERSGARSWPLPNGVVITTRSLPGQAIIEIDVRALSPLLSVREITFPLVTGILFRPSSDAFPNGLLLPPSPGQPLIPVSEVVWNDRGPDEKPEVWFYSKRENLGDIGSQPDDPLPRFYRWPEKRKSDPEGRLPLVHERLLHGSNYWFNEDRSEVLSWSCTDSIKLFDNATLPQSEYIRSDESNDFIRRLIRIDPRFLSNNRPYLTYRGHVIQGLEHLYDEQALQVTPNTALKWFRVTGAAFVAASQNKVIAFTLTTQVARLSGPDRFVNREAVYVGRITIKRGIPTITTLRKLADIEWTNLILNIYDWKAGPNQPSSYLGGIAAVNGGQLFFSPDGQRAVGTRATAAFLSKVALDLQASDFEDIEQYAATFGPTGPTGRLTGTSTSFQSDLLSNSSTANRTLVMEFPVYHRGVETSVSINMIDNTDLSETYNLPSISPSQQSNFSVSPDGSVVARSIINRRETLTMGDTIIIDEQQNVDFSTSETLYLTYLSAEDAQDLVSPDIDYPVGGVSTLNNLTGVEVINESNGGIRNVPFLKTHTVTILDPVQDVAAVETNHYERTLTIETIDGNFIPGSSPRRNQKLTSVLSVNNRTAIHIDGTIYDKTISLGGDTVESFASANPINSYNLFFIYNDSVNNGSTSNADTYDLGIRADFFGIFINHGFLGNDYRIDNPAFSARSGMLNIHYISISPVSDQVNRFFTQIYAHRGDQSIVHYKCGRYGFVPLSEHLITLIELMRPEVLVIDTLGLLDDAIRFPGANKGVIDVGIV